MTGVRKSGTQEPVLCLRKERVEAQARPLVHAAVLEKLAMIGMSCSPPISSLFGRTTAASKTCPLTNPQSDDNDDHRLRVQETSTVKRFRHIQFDMDRHTGGGQYKLSLGSHSRRLLDLHATVAAIGCLSSTNRMPDGTVIAAHITEPSFRIRRRE